VKAGHKGVFHFDFAPEAAGSGIIHFDVAGERAHFDVEVHHAHSAECTHDHDHGHSHADAHEHSHAAGDHVHAHTHADGDHAHGHDGHQHAHADENHHHAHHAHAPHPGHGVATEGKPGDISFSKEQSWKIDFATAVAGSSSFDGVVKVAARVEALPSNYTTLVAATSGKVQFAGNLLAGKAVKANEPLFYLEGGDVTDNDAAVKYAEAESEYLLAKADYERKKLLFIDKIVSEREYQEAEAAFRRAEARYSSMQRSFGDGKVCLRSPLDGYIVTLLVANGDYVQPGTPVATVQRDGSVNVVAELPVRYASQLRNVENVNIELSSGEVLALNGVSGNVVVGSAVNECNMIPVAVTADIDGVVPGSIVTLYLTSSNDGVASVVVPRSAIVEEMGSYFVFVQNSPVSFEKRSVSVGATDGMLVKVNSGVHAGERVVTKGAVVLKLSQGAAALDPHAGHVH
jgi:RND family efflux transporter MFP subunit